MVALLSCVDCGGKVSDKAEACPHCGCPVKYSLTNKEKFVLRFKKINRGKHISFGRYPTGSDGSVEPIKWRILSREDNKILLISEYGLDAHVFNFDDSDDNDWETSELRRWLNNEFKNKAFNKEEQSFISGEVFCLSVDEAEKYFSSDNDRKCIASGFAQSRGVYAINKKKKCDWWLRSPGYYSFLAACVNTDGNVYTYGGYVGNDDDAVRPALWINL